MLKQTIYKIKDKEVAIRSEDYYARSGDVSFDDTKILEYEATYDTVEECVEYLEELKEQVDNGTLIHKYYSGTYIIVPTFII